MIVGRNTSRAPMASSRARGPAMKNADLGFAYSHTRLATKPTTTMIAVVIADCAVCPPLGDPQKSDWPYEVKLLLDTE